MDKKKEINDKIDLYLEQNSYVNIVEETGTGPRFWNGFILNKIKINNTITFFDVIRKTSFPIIIDNVEELNISIKKNPDNVEALKILKEWEAMGYE